MTWKEKYRSDPDLAESIIETLRQDLKDAEKRAEMLAFALERIRDSEYVVYEKVRQIAREALATTEDSSALQTTDKDSLTVDHILDARKKV
jgi:hypothetical protein